MMFQVSRRYNDLMEDLRDQECQRTGKRSIEYTSLTFCVSLPGHTRTRRTRTFDPL